MKYLVQVDPIARNFDVRFIYPPGSIRVPQVTANASVQDGRIALDPTPDGHMVNGQTALRHHLLQIAIRQGVSQIPANAQENDHIFEVPSAEQRRSFWGHDIPYQISSVRLQQNHAFSLLI